MNRFLTVPLVAATLMLGCASPQPTEERDSGPERPVDLSHVPEPVPRAEVRTRAGNKNPYTVLGKTYHLMEDETQYKERGEASWYGTKFHGRKTSNGETYDMYAMTAAHKTLPIPSYVRVTNLNNGRSVVVRVNDRGPFHGGRIIDLSYAAAQRLGFVNSGVAPVEVEIINTGDQPPAPLKAEGDSSDPVNSEPGTLFLQVGAFSSEAAARAQAERVTELTDLAVTINPLVASTTLYRVRVGPLSNNQQLQQLQEQLRKGSIGQAHLVRD